MISDDNSLDMFTRCKEAASILIEKFNVLFLVIKAKQFTINSFIMFTEQSNYTKMFRKSINYQTFHS